MPATLFVVATPIGNLEDITARALRVLREVSLIAAEDTRRTAHLLARYAISTPTTSLHAHNEAQKSASLIGRLKAGESIAIVSDAGTPTISDPGARLIREAIEAGIRVEPIPGPNAALAALAVSGMPADTFTFLGFPPTRAKDRKSWFDRLSRTSGTAIFFEAPHRLRRPLQDVLTSVGDRPVVLARELTKAHEELVRGPSSEALQKIDRPLGEFTVVIDLVEQQKQAPSPAWPPAMLAAEFGYLIETGKSTRRAAIAALAKKYHRPAREVYAAVERAKMSAD